MSCSCVFNDSDVLNFYGTSGAYLMLGRRKLSGSLGKNMKVKLVAVFCLLLASAPTFAQEQTEAQCAKQVDATVSAIDMVTKQTGTEKKLKDLSVSDIRNMQKAKGSCATMQEINKRTMS